MVIYSRFANERFDRFCVLTEILEINGKREVIKKAAAPEAVEHIKNLAVYNTYLKQLYSGTRFVLNDCTIKGKEAHFPFIVGKSMRDVLDENENDRDTVYALFTSFFHEIDKTADQLFVITPSFTRIFGEVKQETYTEWKASSVADLDLILDNILLCGKQWNVIDYEWTVLFPVPIKFIKWRTLFYYDQEKKDASLLRTYGIYELAGIADWEEKCFLRMEIAFQHYIGCDRKTRQFSSRLINGSYIYNKNEKNFTSIGETQGIRVYTGTGDVFNEDNSFFSPIDKNGTASISIKVCKGESYRIDPSEDSGLMQVLECYTDRGILPLVKCRTNGKQIDRNTFFFATEDPWLIIDKVPEDAEELHITESFHHIDMDTANLLINECLNISYTDAVRIYYDEGHGICEENAAWIPLDKKHEVSLHIPLSGLKSVRIDPAEKDVIVVLWNACTDQGQLKPDQIRGNYIWTDHTRYSFSGNDPYFVFDCESLGNNVHVLYLGLQIIDMSKDSHKEFQRIASSLVREQEVAEIRLEEAERERGMLEYLQNGKLIKLYRKERKLRNVEDPFASITRQLDPAADTVLGNIDKAYPEPDKNCIRIEGWCFDRSFPIRRMRIYSDEREIPVLKTDWFVRSDVSQIFSLPEDKRCGFVLYAEQGFFASDTFFMIIESLRGWIRLDGKIGKKEMAAADKARAVVYDDWARRHIPSEDDIRCMRGKIAGKEPKISIVCPLYRTPERYLREMIDSVRTQYYENWELVLSDGSGEDSPIEELLQSLTEDDTRIRVLPATKQMHISENTNRAINDARGDWILFIDHDDLLAPQALGRVAEAALCYSDADFVYSDEDKIGEEGLFTEPCFKPDYNFDYLCSVNYICHLVAIRRTLLEKIGELDPSYDGAQDHDFVLRATEKAAHIVHIPEVLYHWRITEESTAADPRTKLYAFEAGKRAVENRYTRLRIPARVQCDRDNPGHYLTIYEWGRKPLLSILIPNKDHVEELRACIRSILEKSTYENYEIIIIENNSTDDATFAYYEELTNAHDNIRIVTYRGSFNFSAINNEGERCARGEYLLFLNNDTELISEDALEQLVYPCMRADIGAVGARLYYPDDTVQHAGVILGMGGIAGHAFTNLPRHDNGYMNRAAFVQDLSAVTAACMAVRRNVFEEVGGFSEDLAVAFNDIDLCMKITKAGYRILYNPSAELYHYESKSRGYEDTYEKQERFRREVMLFQRRWGKELEKGDPFYNPNLSLGQSYTLKEEM